MNQEGAVGPIAGAWDDDGTPIPEASNVALGGHTWNVYFGNIGFNVISFVRTGNTNSGTVDLLALLRYADAQGWYANPMISDVGFGFEITSSAGGLDFTVNTYSCSFN